MNRKQHRCVLRCQFPEPQAFGFDEGEVGHYGRHLLEKRSLRCVVRRKKSIRRKANTFS
jgi:hypothetical protein